MVRLIRAALIFTAGYIMGAGGCDLLMAPPKYSPLEEQVKAYERRIEPQEYMSDQDTHRFIYGRGK